MTGRLHYIWYANGVRQFTPVDPAVHGVPFHPRRQIFSAPPVYESARGGTTYPLWFDPTYWCEGLTWRFDFGAQMRAIKETIWCYYQIVFRELSLFTVGSVILAAFCWSSWPESQAVRLRLFAFNLLREYHLLLPPLAAVIMYAFVHVEGRFLGAVLCPDGRSRALQSSFPPTARVCRA